MVSFGILTIGMLGEVNFGILNMSWERRALEFGFG